MLVAIDLQNDTFHPEGSNFAEWTERISDGINRRIDEAIRNDEPLIYTVNEYPPHEHVERDSERIRFDEAVYEKFKGRLDEHGDRYKKTFYGISAPEVKEIYDKYHDQVDENTVIEFLGVETHVCILANIMIIQSIFPEANFLVNKKLVASGDDDFHDKTLEILSNLNVEIIE